MRHLRTASHQLFLFTSRSAFARHCQQRYFRSQINFSFSFSFLYITGCQLQFYADLVFPVPEDYFLPLHALAM